MPRGAFLGPVSADGHAILVSMANGTPTDDRLRHVEWNKSAGMVTLGPPGRECVEDKLVK